MSKIVEVSKGLMFVLFLIVVALALPALAGTMPMPAGQTLYQYAPVAVPVIDDDASIAKPIGVGDIVEGGDSISLLVNIDNFDAPVDIYLGLYFPTIDTTNIYLVTETGMQTLSQGLAPWKREVTSVNEDIFGQVPFALLPQGSYTFLLLVTTAGNLSDYYLWLTEVKVPGIGVCYIDTVCSAGNQYSARDKGSNACVASSSCTSLYACQAATTGGSCGGSNKCTQSPGCSSGVQRCSDGICTAASTCDGSNIVAGCP